MSKKELRELESVLDYAQGAISGYRNGLNKGFIPHGIAHIQEKIKAARRDLEKLGLYEQCLNMIQQVEALIKRGSAHDEEAEKLILNASRNLMQASGSNEAIRKKLREKKEPLLEDFKPDPDRWAQED